MVKNPLRWFAAMASVALLGGQTIRVQTREVIVDVTVTDSRNVAVRGLEKQDFTILDEGKPRVIDGFEITQDQPLISAMPATPLHMAPGVAPNGRADAARTGHSTAIILDEANSWFADAVQARQNVVDLMGKLPSDERIAVYIIVRKKGLVLVQDYSTDRDSVKRNLAKQYPTKLGTRGNFYTDQPSPPYDGPPPDTEAQRDMMWRENSDAARYALQALAEQLAKVPGRKSVFWLTNAFPPKVMQDLALDIGWDKTITALNEANVAVNTVDSRGLYAGSNQVTGTVGTMRKISDATGGNTYFNRNDLDGAIAEGIAASRANYSLRFHLADDERDNKFHALKVKVDRPGVQLFYRQGYYAGGTEIPVDLVSEKIVGKGLEARANGADAVSLNADMQAPYFYAGTNRANVQLSVDLTRAGVHGQTEIVGIALRPDGSEAARFADTVTIEGEDRQAYRHQFTVPAGSYVFRLEVGTGTHAAGKKEVPLVIDPWNSASFGIGGIAFSTELHPVDPAVAAGGPAPPGSLIAGGKEFTPGAAKRFPKSQRVYFYTEIYEPALSGSNPAALTIHFRVLDRATGELKQDSGTGSIGGYIRPGDPVVPFATTLPIGQLAPGQYRLEVSAGHSTGPEIVTRTIDFEVE